MIPVAIFITAALTVISLTMASNLVFFKRLRPMAQVDADLPLVSVMIPARNEATVIANTITHLIAQDYPDYEIILLDDNSDDGTAEIASKAANGTEKLTIINGKPLPAGWMGKNWACHQMAQQARGDVLVFTDADVIWEPQALGALIQNMQATQADMFTIWPTQHTVTWWERLTVPLMAMVILGYLPVIGTHYLPLGIFGAANGQCMVWRRNAYERIGGHEIVSDNVLEDVTLARMVKAEGMRLRMADGNRFVSCRMYTDWTSVRNGYAKNILAGYGNVGALIAATIFHLLVFIFPWVWLLAGLIDPDLLSWPLLPLVLVLTGLIIRAVTAAYTHQRVYDALLMPISVFLMTRIAFQAIWWHYTQGGPSWKGRVVRKQS